MLVFEEREKLEYPEKNLLEQGREPTTTETQPHMTPGLGVEPGPRWWEASAFTTAPSLLPMHLRGLNLFKGLGDHCAFKRVKSVQGFL